MIPLFRLLVILLLLACISNSVSSKQRKWPLRCGSCGSCCKSACGAVLATPTGTFWGMGVGRQAVGVARHEVGITPSISSCALSCRYLVHSERASFLKL